MSMANEKAHEKALEKASYFLKRAKETSDLEAKLILLNNAYNCFDGLKPAYSIVFMSKEEYQALISACANDSDMDILCRPSSYNLEALCKLLQSEVEKLV